METDWRSLINDKSNDYNTKLFDNSFLFKSKFLTVHVEFASRDLLYLFI